MQHDPQQKSSRNTRILSLETLLLLIGIASLVYGLLRHAPMNIFWGVVIIPGVFVLRKVRNKDWQAHWAELEEQQRRMQQYEEERKRHGD